MSNSATLDVVRPGLSPVAQGILWKVLSVASFVCINTLVKWLSLEEHTSNPLHVNVIHFYQNLFGLVFMMPIIIKLGHTKVVMRYPSLHVIRVLGAVTGMWCWYLAIHSLPMAQCVALNFLGPIFTVVGAWLLLGEHLNFTRVTAIMISFSGALLVLYPKIKGWTQGLDSWECLLPVLAALFLCANKLCSRQLSHLGEKPEVLTAVIIIFSVPASLLTALWCWTTPSVEQMPHMMLIGALTALAHYSLSRAYAVADAILLAPFGFLKFLFSVVMGYIFFSEVPADIRLWVGTIIILSGLTILSFSKKQNSLQVA